MVTLLLRATRLHPDLPLFAPEWTSKASHRSQLDHTINPAQQRDQSEVAVPITNPQESSQQQPSTIYVQHDDEDEDDGYRPDEHPAHYVRPGKGLMSTLPPDKDDEKYLVDEESSRGVFHHVYLVDETTANQGADTGLG